MQYQFLLWNLIDKMISAGVTFEDIEGILDPDEQQIWKRIRYDSISLLTIAVCAETVEKIAKKLDSSITEITMPM